MMDQNAEKYKPQTMILPCLLDGETSFLQTSIFNTLKSETATLVLPVCACSSCLLN